jgi:hypothetical protein
MLTRSQRISHENLRLHAMQNGSKATSAWFAQRAGVAVPP